MDRVSFTKKDVRNYLDACIRKWRKIRDTQAGEQGKATYYIDAYQSVRTSLFGRVLGVESKSKEKIPCE